VKEILMARTSIHAAHLGLALVASLALSSAAMSQSSPPGPAQPAAPAQPRPTAPTTRPATPPRTLNANRPVQTPAVRPAAPAPAPQAPPPMPPQPDDEDDQPMVGGYNNPGGLVDSTALQTQAMQGVHYHYHYYGAGAVVNPGYAQTSYVNPATAPIPNNPYLTPIYGPGNPAPMNTLAGAGNDNFNGPGAGAIGAAVASGGVAGQAWGYGGGIGHFNPFAYGGEGYVEGFND
jgi:hypothetical protein